MAAFSNFIRRKLTENISSEIKVENVDFDIMKLLVDHVYTQKPILNADNALKILDALDQLEIDESMETDLYQHMISVEKSVSVLLLAQNLGHRRLKKTVEKLPEERFYAVSGDILRFSIDRFIDFLQFRDFTPDFMPRVTELWLGYDSKRKIFSDQLNQLQEEKRNADALSEVADLFTQKEKLEEANAVSRKCFQSVLVCQMREMRESNQLTDFVLDVGSH